MSYLSKFRAFQLDSPGSLFSYYKNDSYTLIEARLPKGGINVLLGDLAHHNKDRADVLHITSWDADHCTYDDLVQILNHLRPNLIQIPPYETETKDGILCRNLILTYDQIHQKYVHNVQIYSEDFINKLGHGTVKGTTDVVYPSLFNCNNKNDMSLIRLFRSNSFNVLSLGDCESDSIAANLMSRSFIQSEIDVLILAHHGANNGFTTEDFLKIVKPKIAVCSSNYGNMYDHPKQEIRQLLFDNDVKLMTTKTGDVIIYQPEGFDYATAVNMISDNEIESSRFGFNPKRNGK
jgi:competence protein ComEC